MLKITPSACGRFLVSMIGAHPRVIPFREALDLRTLYRAKASEMRKAGNAALADHEEAAAHSLSLALNEAASFSQVSKAELMADPDQ